MSQGARECKSHDRCLRVLENVRHVTDVSRVLENVSQVTDVSGC